MLSKSGERGQLFLIPNLRGTDRQFQQNDENLKKKSNGNARYKKDDGNSVYIAKYDIFWNMILL